MILTKLFDINKQIWLARTTIYSLIRFLVGFAIAALMAWKPTVKTAMPKTIPPANANIHHLASTWYAKFCSQLCINHQANGTAIKIPIRNQIKNLRSSLAMVKSFMPSFTESALQSLRIGMSGQSFNNSLTSSRLLKRMLYNCATKTTAFHDQVYLYR